LGSSITCLSQRPVQLNFCVITHLNITLIFSLTNQTRGKDA
jgi:hypothetical protein